VKTSDAYPYNPEKAKSMLAELGWKPGPGGILEKDGKPFKTVFVTPSGRYLMDVQITEGIQAQLKKIGVETSVSIVEGATFMQWQMTDYEGKSKADTGLWLITLTTGPEAGMSMGNNVYSGSMPPRGSNYFMWKNEEFDQVLVAAGKEFDAAKRGQLLQKAQDILAEEVPILPIYVCRNILALRKGVNGVEFRNPFDFYRVSEKAYIE
jgi:peptide/nickel transport system substrate-binding protein